MSNHINAYTFNCQQQHLSWHVTLTVFNKGCLYIQYISLPKSPQHTVCWNPIKTVENVYGSFQTAEKKWSNSWSEKSPLDLKNNSANQSIQTRYSYENFQISTTNLCCLHVWMLQQAACRSTFPAELLLHQYTELFVSIHKTALLDCIIKWFYK